MSKQLSHSFSTGPRNLITDVGGITVGNAQCHDVVTGVTVVHLPPGNTCAVDVRGGSPATRETDLLRVSGSVVSIDAIVLSGGSVYGLSGAEGAIDYLQENNMGFAVKNYVFPVVPAASLFDVFGPGDKCAMSTRLYRELGYKAAKTGVKDFELGSVGAGYGARAQHLKSGLGSASIKRSDGLIVSVLLAANPTGSVTIPGTNMFWAWPFERDQEYGGHPPPTSTPATPSTLDAPEGARTQTIIGLVATNARLSRPELSRIAAMAHDGLSRAINPVHMPEDGDILFAVSTNELALDIDVRELGLIGALAADCTARAIARAVYEAKSVGYLKSYKDQHRAQIAQT
jgi:L-aminopeptidase/D-esterase-like protein